VDIQGIQEKLRSGAYHWRQQAIQRSIERAITETEVVEAIVNGIIIEAYPEDKYGLSCLILGRIRRGRPLHVQYSLPPTVWIITLYEPDPEEWSDFRIRKSRSNP
jgi:hypothetical protein